MSCINSCVSVCAWSLTTPKAAQVFVCIFTPFWLHALFFTVFVSLYKEVENFSLLKRAKGQKSYLKKFLFVPT